jgi:pimeloyl-ACP methyl ester carboxylesterase
MIRPTRSSSLFTVACLATVSAGCLSEQSFPMRTGDLVPMSMDRPSGAPLAARDWLARVGPKLNQLLPRGTKPPLLTEELTQDGRPVDVMAHFSRDPRRLQKLIGNFSGIVHTAQCVGAGFNPGEGTPWPGFEEVWIPIREDLSLCGWLAMAREGGRSGAPVLDSNCIVLLPGLLGNHEINRTRDLARALLDNGHHVLSIELRGHGKTDLRYPDIGYNFGVTEVQDLLLVSEWLEARPHIKGTGLVGFCWGANTAMIAAWFDGRSADDPNLSPRLREILGPPRSGRHFSAGVIAFSPTLRYEEVLEVLKTPRSMTKEPMYAGLQDMVLGRAQHKAYANPTGDLRWLIDREYERSVLSYPNAVEEGLTFLRWMPFQAPQGDDNQASEVPAHDDPAHEGRARIKPAHDKASSIRIPTLIVVAANDPLVGGQDLADFIAGVRNPGVAALLTPGGGHVGFAAWNRRYYFNLILSFFDTRHGPGARRP